LLYIVASGGNEFWLKAIGSKLSASWLVVNSI
jgi:hypothetical protein